MTKPIWTSSGLPWKKRSNYKSGFCLECVLHPAWSCLHGGEKSCLTLHSEAFWGAETHSPDQSGGATWLSRGRPLVCRHQRVKGEESLSSATLISSNDLLSKSQLLLRHDQREADHGGLFELHCSSLQPLQWRPRALGWGTSSFFFICFSFLESLCKPAKCYLSLAVWNVMLWLF